jgi:hypothetical protein
VAILVVPVVVSSRPSACDELRRSGARPARGGPPVSVIRRPDGGFDVRPPLD